MQMKSHEGTLLLTPFTINLNQYDTHYQSRNQSSTLLLNYWLTIVIVHCYRVVQQAELVFQGMQELPRQAKNAERCVYEKIMCKCALHRDICLSLENICAKLRLKQGEPPAQDYSTLQ
jgi:hypothetical protein